MNFPTSQKGITIDLFLPSLQLGFEYQGELHYDIFLATEKDVEKKLVCIEHGINLVDIPYWWNKEEQIFKM